MVRKNIFLFIFFVVLIVIDSAISGHLALYFSVSFLSIIIVYLDYTQSVYFALLAGVVFDIFFASYIGQFTFPIVLLALLVQTIKSFYAIHKLILSGLFMILFFAVMYVFSKSAFLIKCLFFSLLLIPIWYIILRKLEVHPIAKRKAS
jgi:hypothetical protein